MRLAASLPQEFPLPVCIVLHMASNGVSTLGRILSRTGPLPALQVQERAPLAPGCLFVARPDRHLVVVDREVRSVAGPRENRHRPSVDVLFRTAADAYGPGVVGVVLTGSGEDGAAGLRAIRLAGGIGIVQDPDEAYAGSMPSRALELGADYRVSLNDLGALLFHLATGDARGEAAATGARVTRAGRTTMETTSPESRPSHDAAEEQAVRAVPDPAPLSGFTCPDCGGRIWEVEEAGVLRFRCRVGHAYSSGAFVSAHTESLEGALWAALNALEESAALSRRMAQRSRERGHRLTAQRLDGKAADAETQAALLRSTLDRGRATTQITWEEDEPGEPLSERPKHVHAIGTAGGG